jgi:CO/xanthine dehydrogenase FAD-binding subunit
MNHYFRPTVLRDALDALTASPRTILAGGTDLYPRAANAEAWGEPGFTHPRAAPILDLSAVDELSQIGEYENRYEFGACVTWSQILKADLPPWMRCLQLAAKEVGGPQIQNRATIAGNLCNASPAADGVPALIALSAQVRLLRVGPDGQISERELDISEFIKGSGRTALAGDELVSAILIPKAPAQSRSTFLKLGARRYLVISIVMVAVYLETKHDTIVRARITVGSCSEVAARLYELEARVEGARLCDTAMLLGPSDLDPLTPIGDIRASAPYRRASALELLRRSFVALSEDPQARL